MRPRDTLYRLATNPEDYRRCHRLMRAEGNTSTLSWPTVVAERNGELMGFLSTHPTPQAIVAGPLITNGSRAPGWIVLRLVEAYEVVLRTAGVTFYYFSVSRGDIAAMWRTLLGRLGFTPYAADAGHFWYMRRL